jgi:transcriptional regulator with XRE-family HTH domain
MRVYILAMEFRKFFARRLKEVRLARGYTQVRLSQMCGLPSNAIAKYETEVIIPSIETLKKLAEALEVSADYFVFDQAKMDGVPKIQDPDLYERYFVLESLTEDERAAALFLLDSLVTRHRVQEIKTDLAQSAPAPPKKANHKEATA